MIESRIVVVQYCDDVRQEMGNKHSLMGCYGSDMLLSNFPTVLPKLCARVQVITPRDRPFSELTIRAELNDETISEVELSEEHLVEPQNELDLHADSLGIVIMAIMTFSPLVLPEPCRLKVFVDTEEETLKGNTLTIRKME